MRTLLEVAYEVIDRFTFGGGLRWCPRTEAEVQEDIGGEILKLAKKQGITEWKQFADKVGLSASEAEAIWNGHFDLITLERADKIAQGLGLKSVSDIATEIVRRDLWLT